MSDSRSVLGMPDHGASLIHLFQVECGCNETFFHHVQGHNGLDDATGTHGMSCIAFQACHMGFVPVNVPDGLGFHYVSHFSGRGMGTDKIHLIGPNLCVFKTQFYGPADPVLAGKDQVSPVVAAGKSDDFRQNGGAPFPACSYSSSKIAPAPSPTTSPSLLTSKGLGVI